MAAAVTGTVVLLRRGRRPWPATVLSAAIFLCGIHAPYAALPRRDFSLTALNVGKGASHVVSFPGGAHMLIDCGSALRGNARSARGSPVPAGPGNPPDRRPRADPPSRGPLRGRRGGPCRAAGPGDLDPGRDPAGGVRARRRLLDRAACGPFARRYGNGSAEPKSSCGVPRIRGRQGKRTIGGWFSRSDLVSCRCGCRGMWKGGLPSGDGLRRKRGNGGFCSCPTTDPRGRTRGMDRVLQAGRRGRAK